MKRTAAFIFAVLFCTALVSCHKKVNVGTDPTALTQPIAAADGKIRMWFPSTWENYQYASTVSIISMHYVGADEHVMVYYGKIPGQSVDDYIAADIASIQKVKAITDTGATTAANLGKFPAKQFILTTVTSDGKTQKEMYTVCVVNGTIYNVECYSAESFFDINLPQYNLILKSFETIT